MRNLDEMIEELKRRKIVPEDIIEISKLSEAKDGQFVAFEGKIKSFVIYLSPPINVVNRFADDLGDEVEERTGKFHTKMLGFDVQIGDGQLIIENEEEPEKIPIAERFNRIIAMMNILGIPQDFVSPYDVIFLIEDTEGEVAYASFSEKARSRSAKTISVDLEDMDIAHVVVAMWAIWEGIKKCEMLRIGHIYKFLGYARHHYYNDDYLSSFINGWIFVEAMTELLWEAEIIKKYGSKTSSPVKEQRNWTAQVKIEELYMLGAFNKETKKVIQELRKKRNRVFHPERDQAKRSIRQREAFLCTQVALFLFYEVMGLLESGGYLDAVALRKKILNTIHGKENVPD